MLLSAFTAFKASAQNKINFNQTKTWKVTTEAAAKSGKLIFVDCYTDWCGPCKWMDVNVFVAPPVADFYNANFINVKIDMEKGEGVELRKKYSVQSFPTFLFVNANGEVVHRTGSRMPVEEFLEEGKKATDPKRTLTYLTKKYEDGIRDIQFLFDYYKAVSKSERSKADKVAADIVNDITNEQLNTALGWNVVNTLSRNENDKLGAYFMAHQDAFNNWTKEEDRDQLKDRLITNTMYGLMRENNDQAFMDKLVFFKKSEKLDRRKQGVMLEAEYYLSTGKTADYVKLTSAAMKNELKDEAEKLSFLARRAASGRGGDTEPAPLAIQKQAYLMAKRSVELNPEEYSIQSTFAQVCLVMKKKKEGLVAAKKTRILADAETSKIQKNAQALLDKIEAL